MRGQGARGAGGDAVSGGYVVHSPLDRLCMVARAHHPQAVVLLRDGRYFVTLHRQVVAEGDTAEKCIDALKARAWEG